MAKFLDKKQQVIDFQLTPYGNYLLSTGIFKPAYYSFYDSNILYDKKYARGTYCKSASCGNHEVIKVVFSSNTVSEYSSMGAGSDGVHGPTKYITAYNGSTPYNFWFKTADGDVEPGTGVIGEKPMIDLRETTSTKEEIAWKFFKDLSDTDHLPFTANHNGGTDIVFLTASFRGPSTDVTQTMDEVNVVATSVYVQGHALESFRAFSDVPVENQNEIEKRIKEETQYLEGILSFNDLELEPRKRREGRDLKVFGGDSQFFYDVTAVREIPRKDIFKFDSAIGDVRFDNENKQTMPAWKIVTLAGQISSSTTKDIAHDQLIPQVNIDMVYSKEIKRVNFEFQDSEVIETRDELTEVERTKTFSDNNTIALGKEHLLLYAEELNAEFLSENFDIEVYEIIAPRQTNTNQVLPHTEQLKRKFFENESPQIIDGMMVRSTPSVGFAPTSYSTSSVEYYFDIYTDLNVNKKIACQGANIFNKDSYYIDIDFECESQKAEEIYYDIYGIATDPEICQT